jgi:hypothetical protein
MKSKFKFKAIQRIAEVFAIVAIVGFSVMACGDKSGGDDGGTYKVNGNSRR